MSSKLPSPPAQPLYTFIVKYLNSLENIDSYSEHTLRSYRVDLGQAFGIPAKADPEILRAPLPKQIALTDEEVLNLCRQAIRSWADPHANERSKRALSPASRNRKIATLKSFLNWLFEKGLVKRDLALQLHAPKVPHRLPHHISVDEATALLQSLKSPQERALIYLLYGGGLRVSEACNAKWKEIDSSKRVIRIRGKGGKERLVALPEKVFSIFEKLPREGDYVFGKEPLSTRKAYDIVRAAGVRAGLLQPLHPHALRHSFATHLLTSGANLRTLQELLGHRTLQATQRYTHIGVDQLARTMERFHPHGNDQAKGKRK